MAAVELHGEMDRAKPLVADDNSHLVISVDVDRFAW